MYKTEKTDYGFKLTFAGLIEEGEIHRWHNELKRILRGVHKGFGVLVDMRELKPLLPQTQKYIEKGQRLLKETGMLRSAVIVNGLITTTQFRHFAVNTGIDLGEIYINASENENWEQEALEWISDHKNA